MKVQNSRWLRAIGLTAAALLSGCAAEPPPVIDKLDEQTGVTVTHSRTPFVFSSGETADTFPQMDLVQLGAIEINRMGSLDYYLWLGITEYRLLHLTHGHPPQFESIVLDLDGDELSLDVAGWSHETIGTSAPVYRKLFETSIDAYYAVELEQIERMVAVDEIKLRTADPDSREYKLSFGWVKPKQDLVEFHRAVLD